MRRHFEEELRAIGELVLSMAEKVSVQLEKALQALEKEDAVLADEVRQSDREINNIENDLEARCVSHMALHSPVAHDLRFLIGVIKINADLERMGDHAVNIAKIARRLSTLPKMTAKIDPLPLGRLAAEMLRDALDAYVKQDVAKAKAVCARDDEADAHRDRLLNELRDEMMRASQSVPRALDLLLATRNMERIADLSTNIAEEAAFIAEARVLRHGADLA
jgi:phosphate transport system protein